MRNIPLAVFGRISIHILFVMLLAFLGAGKAMSAEYAALVMDARNGKVLHSRNADKRLHPASLTKMMTLYVAFEAIENREISLDTVVTVSRKAAAEPPSELGLRTGQKIKLRYLIRAAAIKSANDASTAIAEAISGSEAAFARRMNRTAKALGMSRTTFKNAHGLTQAGHLSTARDMTIMGRHIFYDYPEYYNIFSRKSADAGIKKVLHTNRRFLSNYRGADGIKTGYTSAAGFNLTASAIRGNERIITTVFGGRSTITRNARVSELMDLGFKRAPSRVAVKRPQKPPYIGRSSNGPTTVVLAGNQKTPNFAAQIKRKSIVVKTSPLPQMRATSSQNAEEEILLAAASEEIINALNEATSSVLEDGASESGAVDVAEIKPENAEETGDAETAADLAALANLIPSLRPERLVQEDEIDIATPILQQPVQRIVKRVSNSGTRDWIVNVGIYRSEFEARKILLKTALTEIEMLDGADRKVIKNSRGYNANFLGLTQEMAELTCRRLVARGTSCQSSGPS